MFNTIFVYNTTSSKPVVKKNNFRDAKVKKKERMRPLVNQFRIHVSEPEFSSSLREPAAAASEKCENQTCPWWPYSNSKDFKTNAGLIVLFLFLAVLSALAINASIRYLRRRRRRHRHPIESIGGSEQEQSQSKEGLWCGETPTVVFSCGMKVAGECAICLSEFVEGEGIRLLNGCNHGFHVECIHKWLSCRSSCPTCRAICLPPCSSTELPPCSLRNHAHREFPSAVTQNPRGPEMPIV